MSLAHGLHLPGSSSTETSCRLYLKESFHMLTLTPNAQAAVSRFMRGAEEPVAGLPIAITGGGCWDRCCGCGKSFSA